MPQSNGLLWLREAVRLSAKNWHLNTALGVGYFGIASLFEAGGSIAFISLACFLGVFMVIGEHAQRGGNLRQMLLSARGQFAKIALIFGVLLAALILCGLLVESLHGLFGGTHSPEISMQDEAAPKLLAIVGLAEVGLFLIACALLFLPVLFLLVPVLMFIDLPISDQLNLTVDAFHCNTWIWRLSLSLAVVCFIGLCIHSVFAIPLLPIVALTMYAGFRDVFLGEPPTKPVKVLAHASALLREGGKS